MSGKSSSPAYRTIAAQLRETGALSRMEPDWTKKIPNWAICDWFFFFFAWNAIVFAILLVAVLYLFSSGQPVFKGVMGLKVFMALIQLIIAGVSTLFFYLLCDRGLNTSSSNLNA